MVEVRYHSRICLSVCASASQEIGSYLILSSSRSYPASSWIVYGFKSLYIEITLQNNSTFITFREKITMSHHNHHIYHDHPTITADLFFTPIIPSTPESSSTNNDASTTTTTIFFISGNPGLIAYYHTFLSLLGEKLKDSLGSEDDGGGRKRNRLQIYGCSLAGFELARKPTSSFKSKSGLSSERKDESVQEMSGAGAVASSMHLYDLEGQIRHVQGKLDEFMMRDCEPRQQTQIETKTKSRTKNQVILVGHSVGAYIAMEVLRRHREGEHKESDNGAISTSESADVDFDIIGGVMLFPTVVDIAKSPSGVKLTVRSHYHIYL